LQRISFLYRDYDVLSATDYYAFGMPMVGRTYSADGYRYGFNGKENDNEVKGEGNQIDYGFRVYDPRIAKFLSVDPLTRKYPELTPYQFASNTPIQAVDLDGQECIHFFNTQRIQAQNQEFNDLWYFNDDAKQQIKRFYKVLSFKDIKAINANPDLFALSITYDIDNDKYRYNLNFGGVGKVGILGNLKSSWNYFYWHILAPEQLSQEDGAKLISFTISVCTAGLAAGLEAIAITATDIALSLNDLTRDNKGKKSIGVFESVINNTKGAEKLHKGEKYFSLFSSIKSTKESYKLFKEKRTSEAVNQALNAANNFKTYSEKENKGK
jgi:RHS repeat-associated protein